MVVPIMLTLVRLFLQLIDVRLYFVIKGHEIRDGFDCVSLVFAHSGFVSGLVNATSYIYFCISCYN
jgi:hypothetical protein